MQHSAIGRGGGAGTTGKEKLHKDSQLQMAFTNKQSNFVAAAGGGESTPLAAKLQQAWLQSRLPKEQDSTPYSSSSDAETQAFDSEAQAFNQKSREPLTMTTPTTTTTSSSSSNTMTTTFTKPTPPTITSMQTSLFSHLHKSSYGAPPPILHSFSTHDANLNNHMSFFSEDPYSVGDSDSPTGGPESLAFLDEMLMQEEEDIDTEQLYMNEESMDYNEMQVTFLDQMLMEGDVMSGSKPSLYQESTAYQAMEKGFADLINEGSLSTSTTKPSYYSFVNSREEGAAAWGAQTECNNVGWNQSLNFNQLSEKFYEDDVMNVYADILSRHIGELSLESSTNICSNSSNNNANHTDVLMRETHNPRTIYKNMSQESTSTRVSMNLPQGSNIGVLQHNTKFAFDSGDEHDLTNLLITCAEAVKQNDVRKASRIIAELRALTSPSGSGAQRMAHYFTDALVAKMFGTGPQLSAALRNNAPSPATMLRAYKALVLHGPYLTLAHFSITVANLNAFKGATRVHLVDYGLNYGGPQLSLIQELAKRPGGAPNLRITGIEQAHDTKCKPSELLIRCGQRLSEFAKTYEVPFQYTAIADKWENITATQLALRPDEVLVVNVASKASNLLDESVMVVNARQMFLSKIRSMNPKVFVAAVANASLNEPFFMSRVRETIKYYSIQFDMLDVIMPPCLKERFLIEQELYGREILNIIACEGLERTERPESYRQWHSRIQRAGFVQKPLQLSETNTIKSILRSYDKRFGIGRDGGWFLSGWRNQVMNAISIWEPT
ncbi:hypothetical protein BDL97_07G109100 [Sphagnum fallax]|nr:hypothetical protein BDL97_07G109100 [Sphagnum fallax]